MHEMVVERERYNLTVLEHSPTGWLLAKSDQLPEVLVQGKNLQQIRERAPNIIRRILERRGKQIESVQIQPPAPESPTHFFTREIVVVAVLADAA